MANTPLTGNSISTSYQGLLKTGDSGALGATEKVITDGLANTTPVTIGTGGVSFTSGTVDFTGATVTGLPAGAAGLESGTGTDSMQSAASLTTTAANASGNKSISLGDGATTPGTGGIAIGDGATTSEVDAYAANDSIAIGVGANVAQYTSGIVIGKNATTSGAFGFRKTSIGQNATTSGQNGISIGTNSASTATGSVALGEGVTAATADTVSVKALEVQTDSTPTTGGIIISDAGGTDRRINIDATGGLQIDSTPVGGGGDPFNPITLSGTSQTLDLGTYNFFDGGTLTADTTLTFSNAPLESRFQYSYIAGSSPYKLQDATNANNENVLGSTYQPTMVAFKSDGTKMYVLRGYDAVDDQIYQFSLSTAFDVTTATYDSVSLNIETQDNGSTCLFWKPDGTQFFVLGIQNDSVYEYNLTTAWDLSTASYSTNSFSVATQEGTPTAIQFKSDGTQFFIVGQGTDYIKRFSMTTAWDITTASFDSGQQLNVNPQDGSPFGMVMNSDGTRFIISGDGTDTLYQYDLTTPYDLTTGSYSNISFDFGVKVTPGNLYGLTANADGSKLYQVLGDSDTVYTINNGATSVTYPASVQNPLTTLFLPGDIVTQTFYSLDTGTNVYVEEMPEPEVAVGTPGLELGAGTDSLQSSEITSTPAIASGNTSISIGNESQSLNTNNISIGNNVKTNGTNLIAIGDNIDATAFTDNSVVIRPGGGTSLAFRKGVAIGSNTYPGSSGVAIGLNARSNQNKANIQIGVGAESAQQGVAIGESAEATGVDSGAYGRNSFASAAGAYAIGPVTASTADTVTMKLLQLANYASMNFADDAAAATGGIPLGGVYHTSGALKIRIV